MRFLDYAKIWIKAGDGGAGCVSFRREKFIEFGGPDGGTGGNGGDVIARCVPHLDTLMRYRYNKHFKAQKGIHGMGRNRTGANGVPVYLDVPAGTQIYDDETEALLADLTEPGQEEILMKGGSGGFGNYQFRSSTNRAPRKANPGLPGDEAWVRLELKVLADVGLLGSPNAGKSTLVSRISAARPKIADYPFTTLHPELGVVDHGEETAFVIADIPGLIEGASEGKGLGHRFLGHVERCVQLLHLVDATLEEPERDIAIVRQELSLYNEALASKPVLYALSKSDALPEEVLEQKRIDLEKSLGQPVIALSSHSGLGLKALVSLLGDRVIEAKGHQRDEESFSKSYLPEASRDSQVSHD